MTTWKDTAHTELWYHSVLEMKILKRHHYAIDFTDKTKISKTIRHNQILENNLKIFVFVYMSSVFASPRVFFILASGNKIPKCWVRAIPHWQNMQYQVMWYGKDPRKIQSLQKLLKEITVRDIFTEGQ